MTDTGDVGRPVEMAKAWPILGSVALAEAVEGGDPLEISWHRLAENRSNDSRAARVADFTRLAFHEPRLRAKWPELVRMSRGARWVGLCI